MTTMLFIEAQCSSIFLPTSTMPFDAGHDYIKILSCAVQSVVYQVVAKEVESVPVEGVPVESSS